MERQKVSLDSLTVDESLNVREGLDDDTIERYVESFEQLPPVVVFEVDSTYLLADGFHRYEAAKRLEQDEIEAEVKEGTRQDAEEYAALANLRHGKPLTRAERRKAVERMLKLHPERSDRWIAEEMGVNHETVRKYREELESTGEIRQLDKLVGKDGKERPREVPHPKRDEQQSTPEVEAPPQEDTTTPPKETPTVEPDPKEVAPEQPQEGDVSEPEVQEGVTGTTVDDEEVAQEESETYDDDDDGKNTLPSDFAITWSQLLNIYGKLMDYNIPDIAQELLNTRTGKREVDKLKGFFETLSDMMDKARDENWW